MGFRHVETSTTSADPSAVWRLWSDPTTRSEWDPSVDRLVIDGPFRVGTSGTLVMVGGVEVPFVLEQVQLESRYLDVMTVGDLTIRIDHVVEAEGTGSRLTVTTEVDGPGADLVGALVTADAPRALASLSAMAEAESSLAS